MVTLYDYLGRGSSQYILDPPPPSKSHHQNYETFLVGNPKRKTVLVTGILGGWGGEAPTNIFQYLRDLGTFFPTGLRPFFNPPSSCRVCHFQRRKFDRRWEIWASGGPPKFPLSATECVSITLGGDGCGARSSQ